MILSVLSGSLFTASATSTTPAQRIKYKTCGDFEYELLDDGTAYIMYYIGSSEKVDIPKKLDNGYVVTGFSCRAFDSINYVESITIPDTVTKIMGHGFMYISEIRVDKNNKVYDSRENCNAIIETKTNTLIAACMNTVIPNGVASIGEGAFADCIDLTSITIPESVNSISCGFREAVFDNCSNLYEIIVDENNKVYDSRENCNAIIETETNTLIAGCMNTVIPDSVTSLVDRAFRGNSRLWSISIPGSVKNISEEAFECCWHLDSVVIEDGVKNISHSAFSSCEDLTSIIIPSSVTSIGDSAFSGCKNLLSVKITDGVTNIGENAFSICWSLTSLKIPKSVTSIGDYAFEEDIKLYVYKDSYAYEYAKSNDYEFVVIDGADNEEESNKKSAGVSAIILIIALCVLVLIILVIVICVLVLIKKRK